MNFMYFYIYFPILVFRLKTQNTFTCPFSGWTNTLSYQSSFNVPLASSTGCRRHTGKHLRRSHDIWTFLPESGSFQQYSQCIQSTFNRT